MNLRLLLTEQPGRFAIARLPQSAGLPEWFPTDGPRAAVWGQDELSLVVPVACVPDGVELSSGWVMLQVTTLAELDEPGIVLAAVHPIAEAGLGVFVISTFLRDYLLVRGDQREQAFVAWQQHGHQIRKAGGASKAVFT